MSAVEMDLCLDRAVEARAAGAVDLLRRLIAAPSPSLAEGRHDDPESVVGILAGALDALGVPYEVVPTGADSETLVAILGRGRSSGPVLILDAHVDTVPAGDPSEWGGLDPLAAHDGIATYLGGERVRLDVGGQSVERAIRARMARVWEARGGIERSIIVGRGAFDNKGPVAVQWLTLASLVDCLGTDAASSGQVVAIFSTDEEQSERGIRAALDWLRGRGYLDRQSGPDGYLEGITAVVLEGSYSYLPVVGHRGRVLLALRSRGRAVHAATPHLGDNAILRMSRLLAALADGWPAFSQRLGARFDDELLEAVTAALGTAIAGGGVVRVDPSGGGPVVTRTGMNVVPDWCEATVDLRHPRGRGYPDDIQTLPEEIAREVEAWVRSLDPQTEVHLLGSSPPAALGASADDARRDPLVAAVLRAREAVLGLPSYVETAPGGTNGTALIHAGRRAGIRTLVECGPGGGLSHEPYEFVDRDDIAAGARILGRIALGVLRADRPR